MGELRKTKRLANIELLRIISMFLIVMTHYIGRGGVVAAAQPLSGIYGVTTVIDAIEIIAVDVYILISGYVLAESTFKYKRLVDIVLQVSSISVGFYILMLLFGEISFSVSGCVCAVFPILTEQYWFVSVYVGLYILVPFINKGLHALTKKQHLNLCILLVLMFSLYLPSKMLGQNGYGIAWMATMYIVGAYLRMHYKPGDKLHMKHVALWIIPTVLLVASRYGILLCGKLISLDTSAYDKWFFKNNSVLVAWAAVAFFVIFLHIRIKRIAVEKVINFAGPLTFGVYLIHNNPSLRGWMWEFINPVSFMNELYFVPLSILIVGVIFALCTILEFIRRTIYNRLLSKIIYRICDSVIEKAKYLYCKSLKNQQKTMQ